MPIRSTLAAWLADPRLRPWLQALLLGLLIAGTWLALTPRPPRIADTGWDKSNHALAFAVLAFNAALAFPAARWRAAACAGWLMLYGGLIEVAQALGPFGRQGEWLDWLADGIGIGIGLIAIRALRL